MKEKILLSNGFIGVQQLNNNKDMVVKSSAESIATIFSNFSFYGYTLSKKIVDLILCSSEEQLINFWKDSKAVFDLYFEEVLDAKNGVVYKNFPSEVLNKEEGELWFNQMLMYLGYPVSLLVEEEMPRLKVDINFNLLKVLDPETEDTLETIYVNYISKHSSFTTLEKSYLSFLIDSLAISSFNISDTPFKNNGAFIGSIVKEKGGLVKANNMNDILRFGAVMSGISPSLKEKPYLFKFKRADRKILLNMILLIKNVEEDIASKPDIFKAFFKSLRPGDYRWAKPVSNIYDRLFNKQYRSFNSKVSTIDTPEEILKSRPGIFLRRFHEFYQKDRHLAVSGIIDVMQELTLGKLLYFKKYLLTINDRKILISRPKSKWVLAKVRGNNKGKILHSDLELLIEKINELMKDKLSVIHPEGVLKGKGIDKIAIPSNDQDISIGRGTIYELPNDINFIRTATYWTNKKGYNNGNFWFDNSWNFIFEDEKDDKVLCWDSESTEFDGKELGGFSGDPIINSSSHDVATQIIDVDLQALKQKGCRYALWSVLSYNRIPFGEAEKVYGILQYLNDQNKGELFEPSKVDLQFSLTGNDLSKCIVLLDVLERKIILLDQCFPKMKVCSASNNMLTIREFLPALQEYLLTIPTIADLVEVLPEGSVPFLYSDKGIEVAGKAYVFNHENPENEFEQINIQQLLE